MSKVNSYVVASPPSIPESSPRWLYEELRKAAVVINELVERSNASYNAPPVNPRPGMVVYAEAPWNPGGGSGFFYGWTGSSWVKLN